MPGTVAYAAVPITARFAVMSAKRIISEIGTYYAVRNSERPFYFA